MVRDYTGKESDRLVTRMDPGVVSLLVELRAHERQAAEGLGQWKTHHEVRKVIDATPPAIKPAARHGEPAQVFPANAAPPDGRPRMDGVMGWSQIRGMARLTPEETIPRLGAPYGGQSPTTRASRHYDLTGDWFCRILPRASRTQSCSGTAVPVKGILLS